MSRMVSSPPSDSLGVMIAEHVRSSAPRYFPDVTDSAVHVDLITVRSRPTTTLYRYRVRIGDAVRQVVAKVPTRHPSTSKHRRGASRPRLAQPLVPERKSEFEYRALSAIQTRLEAVADARFHSVRVLDRMAAYRVLIMEFVPWPPLRKLFHDATLWPARIHDLEAGFRNSGAWLRLYHALEPHDSVEQRHSNRQDFADFITEICAYLAERTGDREFFEWVSEAVVQRTRQVLPEELPLGLNHGDFAMRNILVGRAGRVAVIDTTGRWCTAVYEDIAFFLVGLRISGPALFNVGLLRRFDRTEAMERAFLKGYFGAARIPADALSLYQVLVMLDRWAAIATPPERTAGSGRGALRSARDLLLVRFFGNQIRQQLGTVRS